MAQLVISAQTDSINDSTGLSNTAEPPQLTNAVDDAIFIQVTQSANNTGIVSGISITTPAGYTLYLMCRMQS